MRGWLQGREGWCRGEKPGSGGEPTGVVAQRSLLSFLHPYVQVTHTVECLVRVKYVPVWVFRVSRHLAGTCEVRTCLGISCVQAPGWYV